MRSGTVVSSTRRWATRLGLGGLLLWRFLGEMLISNLAQARLVLGRPLTVRPRWVVFPTRLRTPMARTLLGAMISMTPGTLTCDLEGDRLLLHLLSADEEEQPVERIRRRFEALLQRMEES